METGHPAQRLATIGRRRSANVLIESPPVRWHKRRPMPLSTMLLKRAPRCLCPPRLPGPELLNGALLSGLTGLQDARRSISTAAVRQP